MSFQSGTRFGPYEILSLIGAGGMGEVYRARDTRLDRLVAIKILPQQLSDRSDLRERFEREARAVAALNHPNVCILFDVGEQDGTHFLVMEYIEGETLAERLTRGALPLDQALKCAAEIADALDKAHRQCVVHRDLKPGNIMLTKSGAKLLDFGLARLKQPSAAAAYSSTSNLPTNATALTAQGVIVGTLQYMAPEQLEGREADARTDIFALGTVMYEMVTGRKAFEGKSQVSLMGAILERDPAPVTSIAPAVPSALEQWIRRSLAKDPDQRWQTAADAAAHLKWIVETPPAAQPASVSASRRRREMLWAGAAAVFLATTLVLAFVMFNRSQPAVHAMRFQISPPDRVAFASGVSSSSGFQGGSISPDGRRIAFTARDASGKVSLWLRPLDSFAAQVMPGTEEASLPFWSPDSQSIGFFAMGKLKRIDISGGLPQIVCDASAGRGGTWNSSGVIVFAAAVNSGLSRVSAAGGTPVALTTLKGDGSHRFPAFLPDGKHVVYDSLEEGSHVIFAGDLDGSAATRILSAESPALYSPSGHLLFIRQGTLFAQPFDTRKLAATGEPVRIAEQVAANGNALAASVSTNGVLIYRNGLTGVSLQGLYWIGRNGKVTDTVSMPAAYMGVDVSPDGKRIATHHHEGAGGDIWIIDSSKSPMSRLTFDAAQDNSNPIWSPDGRSIAFSSLRNGKWGLYRKLADGTGAEEKLLEMDNQHADALSWSADEKLLVYSVTDPKTNIDIWVLPMTGERKPYPFVQMPGAQGMPQVSPDGKWMAYLSNESGRDEIYVRSFPDGVGKWQVTTNGSSNQSIRWRGDTRELYYTTLNAPQKLMAIPVNPTGTTFQWGTPEELFVTGYASVGHPTGGSYHDYAVSPNGQSFLFPRSESPVADTAALPINVVLNWPALLK